MIIWLVATGYREGRRELYSHAMVAYTAEGDPEIACGTRTTASMPFWQVATGHDTKHCPVCEADERVRSDDGEHR